MSTRQPDTRPDTLSIPQHRVHLWIVELTVPDTALSLYHQHLRPNERERAARFKFVQHRRAFVVARSQLRLILSQYLQQRPADISFRQNEYGKPYLDGTASDSARVYFNISHSGDKMLMALNGRYEVGVDIEQHNCEVDFRELVRQFFSEHEQHDIFQQPPAQQCQAFFDYWSHKEAFIKALGTGLSTNLKDFSIHLMPDGLPVVREDNVSEHGRDAWTLFNLTIAPGYSSALAIQSSQRIVIDRWRASCLA